MPEHSALCHCAATILAVPACDHALMPERLRVVSLCGYYPSCASLCQRADARALRVVSLCGYYPSRASL
eukprot:scaffold63926_cov45-Phaeocystis_antarctica.AAC.1